MAHQITVTVSPGSTKEITTLGPVTAKDAAELALFTITDSMSCRINSSEASVNDMVADGDVVVFTAGAKGS